MKLLKTILITILFIVITLAGVFLYARYIEPGLLVVNQVNLHSQATSSPLKIVFFGDTHLGEFANPEDLDRIVEKINAQHPDLVVFTGDLIDAKAPTLPDPAAVAAVLQKIQAPYGKFAVIGNHEYALEKAYSYADLMAAGGFTLLVNDWLDISQLNVRLLFLDDLYLGQPDLTLSDNALDGAYNVLLTHEPDVVDKMNLDGIQLILAGHTHGGQISIPFLTEQILPSGGKKYVKGLYHLGKNGQTALFVTKGTGMTRLPFRFMNVPEIVAITVSPN